MPRNGKGVAGTVADKRHKLPGNVKNLQPYQWKPGQSGNPKMLNVRRKTTNYLKKIGYNLYEINDALAGLLAMTPPELQEFIDRPNATVLEQTVGKSLLKGMRSGSLWNLETILTRTFGQPTERMEVEEKHIFEVTLNLGGPPRNNEQTTDIIHQAMGGELPAPNY